MAKTVIDELIVTLGLDTSQFTTGQKQAAQALIDTQHTVQSSVSSMTSALTGFAGKLTAFFLGFEGLRGVIDLVRDTTNEFKQLGITAELMGTQVREARVLEEISELAGGGKGSNQFADFIQGGRQQLAGMVFRMPTQLLPLLLGLNPFQFFAGDPLQQMQLLRGALAGPNGGRAQQMLSAVLPGISRDAANALLLERMGMPAAMTAELINPQHLQTDLKTAQKTNKNITDQTAENARRAANALIDLRYHVENTATLAFPLLTSATNLLQVAFNELAQIVSAIVDSPFAKWIEKEFGSDGAGNSAVSWVLKTDRAVAGQEWQWTKDALHGLQRVPGFFGFGGGNINDLQPFPMMAHVGVPGASLIGGGGQNTHLSIGSMTVNTKATDAAGVAAGMHAAIRRKFDVTQADSGIVQ